MLALLACGRGRVGDAKLDAHHGAQHVLAVLDVQAEALVRVGDGEAALAGALRDGRGVEDTLDEREVVDAHGEGDVGIAHVAPFVRWLPCILACGAPGPGHGHRPTRTRPGNRSPRPRGGVVPLVLLAR